MSRPPRPEDASIVANGAHPSVSVVIPTRDRRALLLLALRSVLAQREVDLEVIVVDDGSTEGMAAAVEAVGDPRLRVARHDRSLGVSAARNRGIEEARGEWVAFLDDDDLWAPEKLALQLAAVHETARTWAYAGAAHVSMDHRVTGGAPPAAPEEVLGSIRRANVVPAGCSNVLVRKEAIPASGFDAAYHHCADWDLWIRLADVGPPAWVPKPLVGYRMHPGAASVDTAGMVAELGMIERRHGGPVDRAAFDRHVARIALRTGRRWRSLGYLLRAAARDSRYLTGDFRPDTAEVLAAMSERIRSRLGRPRPTRRPRRSDSHRAWREEAQGWVDRLVRAEDGG